MKSSKGRDCATCLGCLFQCLTVLIVKNTFISCTTSLTLNWRDVSVTDGPLGGKGIDCIIALRVVVSGLMCRWRPVMSGIPQGLVLRLVLFNIFASGTDSGIECTLRTFAGNIRLCGTVDVLE